MNTPWMPVAYNPRVLPQYAAPSVIPDPWELLSQGAWARLGVSGPNATSFGYTDPYSEAWKRLAPYGALMPNPYTSSAAFARLGNAGFPAYQTSDGRGNLSY